MTRSGPEQLDRMAADRAASNLIEPLALRVKNEDWYDCREPAGNGNLSVHARKLEEADYIACDKRLAHMEAIIRASRS